VPAIQAELALKETEADVVLAACALGVASGPPGVTAFEGSDALEVGVLPVSLTLNV
jgi:hypothetical protein